MRQSNRTILIITALSSFLTPFMASSVTIAMPEIGKEYGMTAVLMSWVATSYILAASVFLIPMGRIADIYGRKRVFFHGAVVYTAASLFSGLAFSAVSLIVFRILHGAAASMLFGTGVAILISSFPPGERGKVLGINVAAVYLGLSLGPVLGGLLTQYWGWRSIFLVNVPMGLFMAVVVRLRIREEWAEAKGERFDLVGALIFGISIVSLMYGFSKFPRSMGMFISGAGLAGFVVFTFWESRIRHPLLDVRMFFSNPVFALSNGAALINYSATFATGFLLSLYLQYIRALSPRNAGFVLVAQPAVMAILSPIAGKLSDRIEPRLPASIGMAITAVSLILFAFTTADTPVAVIMAELAFMGIGLALFSSPNTHAVMASVERRHYGIASATIGTMRLLGQMMSMGIAMLVFAVFLGDAEIQPENYPLFIKGIRVAFVIFACSCVAGIAASGARGKVHG